MPNAKNISNVDEDRIQQFTAVTGKALVYRAPAFFKFCYIVIWRTVDWLFCAIYAWFSVTFLLDKRKDSIDPCFEVITIWGQSFLFGWNCRQLKLLAVVSLVKIQLGCVKDGSFILHYSLRFQLLRSVCRHLSNSQFHFIWLFHKIWFSWIQIWHSLEVFICSMLVSGYVQLLSAR